MSEFEGRGKSLDAGYANARRSEPAPRERTAKEKAADAKTLARNLDGFEQRVHDGVAAMAAAERTNDRAAWDAAKRDADGGVKDIRSYLKRALAAANDATDAPVRERLATIEEVLKEAENATTTASAQPPTPRAPELRIADDLLAALPPVHQVSPAKLFYETAQLAVEWVFRERASTSDLAAFKDLVAEHRDHEIVQRFRRFGREKQGALLALLEKDEVKLPARKREQQRRREVAATGQQTPIGETSAADPTRQATASDSPERSETAPPEPELAVAGEHATEHEQAADDVALVQRKARGAADVEHGDGKLAEAPSAALGSARAPLGPQIAVAAGAIYVGEGAFQIPELPGVLITVQRTATAARRRRTASEIVLEIPRGLADDELARVTIEQLSLLRNESPATTEDVAADGVRDAADSLPHHEQIQRSFGDHRVDHVRAQIGGPAADAAAQIGATAYATGDRVGFADSPSLHTAAHEAAHVVQQRSGVALRGNIGQAGDEYEQHADAVADQVVRGESAEALLDEMTPRASGGGGATSAVQRKEQGASSAGAAAADGPHQLVRGSGQTWQVFAASGKPYIIEARDGKPGAWVVRDWVKAAPDAQQIAGGWKAPSRARELLTAMGWVEPERIELAADRLHFSFARSYEYLSIGANAMKATGLPAETDAVVERGGDGALQATIRLDDPSLPPDTRHIMTASEQTRAIRALAKFTGLVAEPEGLRLVPQVIATRQYATGNGVLFFTWERRICRVLFGIDAYERWRTGKPPEADRDEKTPKVKLENYYKRPIPGELSHHADIVESGEQIRLEALVNWPADTPNPAIYEIVPMVTPSKFGTVSLLQCNWRFERLAAGGTTPAVPAAAASAAQEPRSDAAAASDTSTARATSTAGPTGTGAAAATATAPAVSSASPAASPVSPGAVPEQAATEIAEVFHRFKLAPDEASATFRVTCDARFDAYFTPTTFTRDVVVMSSAAALSSLRTAAFTGLGGDDAARRGGSWTADASAALTASPPTGGADATARGRATQRTQLEAVRAHLSNNPASADAVAAIDRELARQAKTEQLLAQDRARGWQPFQLRGTYLSRTEGLASGPLDLHGTVHVEHEYDGSGGEAGIAIYRNEYVVQIRDLSRRFEQQDFTFEGRGDSFDRALGDAFEDLAVAYPKGMVAIEAEQLASRAGAADGEAVVGARTGKVVGFQRSTETTWKKVKETVWDPVASLAVNLGAIALMTLVPGSAAIVAPAIIAYNSIPALDRIVTEDARGTLTTDRFATSAGEIALNLLPVLGRARPFTVGWFAVETANWGGQVALMTVSAIDAARGLQAKQVAELAIEYEALLQLQKRSLPSDPNLAAAEAKIRQSAATVADEISKQIEAQIFDNGIMMVTGSVIHHSSVHARTAILEQLARQAPRSHAGSVRAPDTAPPRPEGTDDATPPKSGAPDARDRSNATKPTDTAPAAPSSERHESPENLTALHDIWQHQRGATVSALHHDPATQSSYFDVTDGQGQTQRIRARVARPIRTAAELIVHTNRIIGHPVAAAAGDELMASLQRGDLTVLTRVGVNAWDAKLPPDTEFGLGELADGHVVVIRGQSKAVDWSGLPGIKPIGHSHPNIKDNDLNETTIGRREATLGEIAQVTDTQLLSRALVLPSPADFFVMGYRQVARHRVYTPFVVHGGVVRKPAPGDTNARLACDILDTRHVGVDRDGLAVFHAVIEGIFDGKRVIRRDIWIVQDRNGTDGKLEMARPAGPDAPPAVPAARSLPDRARLLWIKLRLTAAAHERVPVGKHGARYDVRVMPAAEFIARFRSESARAQFQLEPPNDQQVIYVRDDATAADVQAETQHVKQMADPKTAAEIRKHHAEDLAQNWDRLSVADRLEHFRRKLEIEIDAYRSLQREGDPASAATLGKLKRLRDEADALFGDEQQLAEMNARVVPMPDYLVDPAYLFHDEKVVSTAHGGPRPDRNTVVDRASMVEQSDIGAERSSAFIQNGKRRSDVVAVRQVGSEWTEAVHTSTGYTGTVAIEHSPDGVTVIVTNDSGTRHAYPLELGAALRIESGQRVESGHLLAIEPSRRYRLVEVERTDGSLERREEIRRKDDGWIKRGSEATRAGALLEDAARLQVDAQLAAKRTAAEQGREYFDSARLPHQRGGGGFDDVIVEFTGSVAKPEAKIRIREVKHYPDRHVPREEFTAIRGTDLQENMKVLRASVQQAIKAHDEGTPLAGFEKLSAEQLEALQTALDKKQIEFEIVLGPTTKMGPESSSRSVLRKLRQDIQAEVQKDALKITGGVHVPEHVDQSWVDQASQPKQATP